MTHKNQNGFTLVELAIALVVIGLLIGSMLKAQELIENARITAAVKDFKSYDAAVALFENAYQALPGDITNPGSRVPRCTTNLCNVPGNGDERLDWNNDHEGFNFFPHMVLAGFLKGPEGGSTAEWQSVYLNYTLPASEKFFPKAHISTVSQIIPGWVHSGGNIDGFVPRTGHVYWVRPVKTLVQEKIDKKIDDGMPVTGSVYILDNWFQGAMYGKDITYKELMDMHELYEYGEMIVDTTF